MAMGLRLPVAIAVGIVAGALMTTSLAQRSMLDPAIVAPHIYEATLENEHVRVLKVTTRNGETAPLHAHPNRVIVYLSSCAWMEDDDDGKKQMESYATGDVVWAERITHGGETSNVVHDCLSLEIELKD